MSAGIYNFLIEQGATVSKSFQNCDINGNPISLPVGTVALFSIKTAPGISNANVILSRSNDVRSNLNTALGLLTITLSSNDTEVVLAAQPNYVYDIFLEFPSGAVTKFLTGSIIFQQSVTHV